MAMTLLLFADFLGYGGANARKSDNTEDYEDYTAEEHRPNVKSDKGEEPKNYFVNLCDKKNDLPEC
jgi:hypothetical protein